MRTVYRYEFDPSVCLDDIEVALVLSLFGVEALHGASAARLDVRHSLCRERRSLVIDASTAAGQDLAKLFLGFLKREIDEDAVRIERVSRTEEACETAA